MVANIRYKNLNSKFVMMLLPSFFANSFVWAIAYSLLSRLHIFA